MGNWINHFIDFEKKPRGENRLVLGFQYCPDPEWSGGSGGSDGSSGRDGHARKVKIIARQNLKIPTKIMNRESAGRVIRRIEKDPLLKEFPLRTLWGGGEDSNYIILEIEIPHNRELIRRLGSEFQRGDYERIMRLRGFYPERTAVFHRSLEDAVISGSNKGECAEVETDNISQIEFLDLPDERILSSLPYVVIDIEKPLWKNYGEKNWLDRRERLLKANRKYEKLSKRKKKAGEKDGKAGERINEGDGKTEERINEEDERTNEEEGKERKAKEETEKYERRKKLIERLEERLTQEVEGVEVEGVGRIKLFDERFRADVSFVTALWKTHEGIEKEIYVLDPNKEISAEKHNGCKVRTFRKEEELTKALTEKFHEKKPVISYGHNQVYDITQLRFASEGHRQVFDPAVKDVKPRRDFVRFFLQRLREDMVYLDTMWMANILFPYLKQKRLDTSLKLEDVARFRGIDFKKSLTHGELRGVELRRLSGADAETRSKAAGDMLNYSTSDLSATAEVVDSFNFIPLLAKMKEALPFCTLSEIAFSASCASRIHELRHFRRMGNLPYHGYDKKRRQDFMIEMKKKVRDSKEKMLKYIGFRRGFTGATHHGVTQLYIPLEEWLKEFAFSLHPPLEKAYNETKDNPEHHFAFLQYLKALMKDPLADYRRIRDINENLKKSSEAIKRRHPFIDIQKMPDYIEKNAQLSSGASTREKLRKLERLLSRSQELYRSIHPYLPKECREIVRPTAGNLRELRRNEAVRACMGEAGSIDELYGIESFLIMMAHEEEIAQILSGYRKKSLGYLTKALAEFLEAGKSLAGGLTYAYPLALRAVSRKEEWKFRTNYGFSPGELKTKIGESYLHLKKEFADRGLKVIDFNGDYVFVTGLSVAGLKDGAECADKLKSLTTAIPVRHLEEYVVG